MAEEKHYYYKAKSGKGYLNLKHRLSKDELKKYVEIEEDEFISLTTRPVHEPTEEEVRVAKAKKEIAGYKNELTKTDWIVVKIAEETDADKITALRSKYATEIAYRKELRSKINILEDSING